MSRLSVHTLGEFCERAKCQEEMCENGGHCVVLGDRAVCYCLPGYTGAKCQHIQVSTQQEKC